MRPENQEKRRREIEEAAYAVLAEKGFKATSMLAIAKRASASNETLYRWYGSKSDLFSALVEKNAADVRRHLEAAMAEDGDAMEALRGLGPLLLQLVTGDRAIALNRAAAGDAAESGLLGKAIARSGKAQVMPLIARTIERACASGQLTCSDGQEAAEVYIGLLIGDLQIQRVIDARGPLKPKEIKQRAERAFRLFCTLYADDGGA